MPTKSTQTKTKSQTKQGATLSKGKGGARAGPTGMKKATTGKRTGAAMAKNAGSSSPGGLNLPQADKVLARFQEKHPRLGKQLIGDLQPHGIATGINPPWR